MGFLLFLLFLALELYLLVKVGGMIGALNMVIWVFASALLGMWAVRAQGHNAMQRFRAEMDAGHTPQTPFLDGLLLFIGGVLLILPGLIGDAVGLLLLIPPVRHAVAPRLSAWLTARQASGTRGGASGSTRIFFFQSGGFSNQSSSGDPFMRQDPGQIGPDHIIFDDTPPQDESPRQATIIDSTAIEIEPQSPAQPPTQPAGEPDAPPKKAP